MFVNAFGLGDFIPIFNILYRDQECDILINGEIIQGYKILRGVKGCFKLLIIILCMEPLIRNIKTTPLIKLINVREFEFPKIFSFADDINPAILRTKEGIQAIFHEYEQLTRFSGLMLNANKTELLCTTGNTLVTNFNYMDTNYALASKSQIKINGIIFSQDPKSLAALNCAKVKAAMERHLVKWSSRNLTLIGKILIAKTYAISQLIYLMQSICLTEVELNTFNNVLFKYLWSRNITGNRAVERIKSK